MEPKVAVVTGGASGMGRIYAERMAKRGVKVAILDLNEEALKSTASESDNITAYPCDTTNRVMVEQVIEQIRRQLGSIDRLVHCAAIMPTACLIDQPTELINKVMTINYGGMVNIVKTVFPDMLARSAGELIVFGSIAGSVLAPEIGAYSASKAATNAFVEVLIRENRNSGVRIMLVSPPMVNTPLLQQATENSNPKNIRDSIEKGRLADPEKMIDAVEKGLASGKEIIYTSMEAKVLMWLRRLCPNLLWKIVLLSNKE